MNFAEEPAQIFFRVQQTPFPDNAFRRVARESEFRRSGDYGAGVRAENNPGQDAPKLIAADAFLQFIEHGPADFRFVQVGRNIGDGGDAQQISRGLAGVGDMGGRPRFEFVRDFVGLMGFT